MWLLMAELGKFFVVERSTTSRNNADTCEMHRSCVNISTGPAIDLSKREIMSEYCGATASYPSCLGGQDES